MLTRQDLLAPAARCRPAEPISLPGLPDGYCCGMDGLEDAEFSAARDAAEKKGYSGPPIRAIALTYLLCDEHGGRLCSPDDATALASLPAVTLMAGWVRFLKLNGWGQEQQEAFLKNSANGQPSLSGATSPSNGDAP